MTITRAEFKAFLDSFNFKELFLTLGWDNVKYNNILDVDKTKYVLEGVVQKRGFIVITCSNNASFPDAKTRKKIDREISRHYFEHLLIYKNSSNKQIWQISVKEPNKPVQYREIEYNTTQAPELLYSKLKGFLFTLDEEDKIGLVDVKSRVTEQFNSNAEKVTKQFYTEFKKQHSAFQSFIEGLKEQTDIDWYTSLMLNRLMFIYFIQKKGFLDGNNNYLSDKLKFTIANKGKNKFYKSFYKDFLLTLFHKGLSDPNHSSEFHKELGKIPYLNGGLFDVHAIEKENDKLNIKDEAFINLFDFFDKYNWHLDVRADATGKDINPDVIGYIFEKYINDRASMGAYYTKEDITEYISKNTIIPFLFNKVKEKVKTAFSSDSSLWKMLKDDPDRYIYDAVSKGIYEDLPDDYTRLSLNERVGAGLPDYINIGIDTNKSKLLERRNRWNEQTEDRFALPTEIWRETIERRKRYWELREKIENNEITEITDFITYNLNIRQFAQDAVEQYEGSDFVNAFYNAIKEITILDPTCGSGAFLFAALNILEPLYESLIARMREFVSIDDEKGTGKKHNNFRDVIADITNHPNEQYFIYKSIILNNLYGVDIMKEATEIAKLRLFLKLVAVVAPDNSDDNYGLEPLPDIDFNIRSGNTLVGFASYKELKDAYEETEANGQFLFGEEQRALQNIEDQANVVADLFREFKKQQTIKDPNSIAYKKTKDKVQKRLYALNDSLNKYLAFKYGIDADDLLQQKKYKDWLTSHKPFHWFADFYEIVHQNGGFDVIIGNPPYVVYTTSSLPYKIKEYNTIQCGNLYAFCVERSFKLLKNNSKFSMILPNSSISADKMAQLQTLFTARRSWISNYAWRPAKLFEGANMLLAIIISSNNDISKVYTTQYYKWYTEYRFDNQMKNILFDNLSYTNIEDNFINGSIPKIPNELFFNISKKIKNIGNVKNIYNYIENSKTPHIIYYFRAVLYWIKILDKEPVFFEDRKKVKTGEMKPFYFQNNDKKNIFISILSSSTFFIHYIVWSSCQVINSRDFNFSIDISKLVDEIKEKLIELGEKLQIDYQSNSEIKIREYSSRARKFTMKKQYFYLKHSKPILDEIDKELSKYYGFTEEELDFIINYDIKYRMGKELNGDDEE